jgi:hypothetical protein
MIWQSSDCSPSQNSAQNVDFKILILVWRKRQPWLQEQFENYLANKTFYISRAVNHKLKMIVCWDAACSLVEVDGHFRRAYCLHHHDDKCSSASRRNKEAHLKRLSISSNYMAQHPGIQSFSYSSQWELEISPNYKLFLDIKHLIFNLCYTEIHLIHIHI